MTPKSVTERQIAGQRGTQRIVEMHRYRIDGEHLTAKEIAARLGLKLSTVHGRLAKLRRASGPITMERLRAMGRAS